MPFRAASTSLAMAAAAASDRPRAWLAPTTRRAVHQDVIRRGCTQAPKTKPRSAPANQLEAHHGATRGGNSSARAVAVQFVGRASRGSAAPGSQSVVYRCARGSGGSGACRGARTLQQPTFRSGRYSAFVSSGTKFKSSFVQHARPNPVFNRTPCGSPPLALISFWAKGGLPQGAG
jgi:hypothetical protein